MSTIQGNNRNNSLYGGSGNDDIYGYGGNDKLYGRDGFDTLLGGEGDDLLDGGKKADILRGQNGNDRLYGDEGRDTLYGGAGNDTVYGGTGNDTFRSGYSGTTAYNLGDVDTWYGGSGNDTFNISHGYHYSTGDYVRIKDFTFGQDRINIGSLNKSLINLQQIGSSVYIRYGSNNTIAIVERSNVSTIRQHLVLPAPSPTANNDSISTNEDNIAYINVLNNDSSGDGGSLTIISENSNKAYISGSRIIYNPGSSYNYLRQGQTTTDRFSYTIRNSSGQTDTATVNVTITGVNDAPTAQNDSVTTNEDTPITINVLGNDRDPDQGDRLSVISETSSNAYISGNKIIYDPRGKFDYLRQGQTTTDNFSYTIRDSAGATKTATVNVTITGVNDVPTAQNDTAQTSANSPININVLNNDSDLDQNDSLSIVRVNSNNIQGSVSIVGSQLQYDPTNLLNSLSGGQTTNETFSYTIKDSVGAESTASVTVTVTGIDVNKAPNFSDQSFTIKETAINSDMIDLSIKVGDLNATDPDGDTLTYQITQNIDIDGDGNPAFRLDDNQLIVNDQDDLDYEIDPTLSITVQASDGQLSDSATISINLTDVNENQAPNFPDQSFTIPENPSNGTIIGTLPATDPDGDPLTYQITQNVDIDGDGNPAFRIEGNQLIVNDSDDLDYEINPNPSITVEASDGELSDSATISIGLTDVNENQKPDFPPQAFVIEENQINGTEVGILKATDPDGDPLTYRITQNIDTDGDSNNAFRISGNKLIINDTDDIDYETNPILSIQAEASDGQLSDNATVFLNVVDTQEPPTNSDQTFISIAPLDAEKAEGNSGTTPFTFDVTRSGNLSETATVDVTIGVPVYIQDVVDGLLSADANDFASPYPNTFTLTFDPNQTQKIVTVNVLGDTIPEMEDPSAQNNREIFAVGLSNPSQGVTISKATATGLILNDDFPSANNAPNFPDQSFTINQNSANGTAIGTLNATDPDNDPLTYQITQNLDTDGDGNNAFRLQGNQLIVNDSDDININGNNQFSITVEVSDPQGLSDSATVTVNTTQDNSGGGSNSNTQNLYNELNKLTDNAQQLEALLKELAGGIYSEQELRQIIEAKKKEAFEQFEKIETQLETNQKAIELTIDQINPYLSSLKNKEDNLDRKQDELTGLEQTQAELNAAKAELEEGKSQSWSYFNGEINDVNRDINAEKNRYNRTRIFTWDNNPAEDLLQSSSEIQGIITRFTAARNSAVAQKGRVKTKKKRNIYQSFIEKFDVAISDLNKLKGYAQQYESLVRTSGATPSRISQITQTINNARSVYAKLAGPNTQKGSYADIKEKIKAQRELWLKGKTDDSINVAKFISAYLKDPNYDDRGGKGISLIYQINAEVSRDELAGISNAISGWLRDAQSAHNQLISTFDQQKRTLENTRNTTDAEFQRDINNKQSEINIVNNNIATKKGEINQLKGEISTINSEIAPLATELAELLGSNETIVKDWKSLLRNESHYFLDSGELKIYDDLYGDWQNLQNNVVAPFISKLKAQNSENLAGLFNLVEEYQEDLSADIKWAENRRELIELIGSSNQQTFEQVLNDLGTSNNSSLPFDTFAQNLQTIKEKRENLLTSYDNIDQQINQVDQWLTEAKQYQSTSNNPLLSRYITQLEFTKERLSIVPDTLAEIDPIKEDFTQDISELKDNWNTVKTTFSQLVNLSQEKSGYITNLNQTSINSITYSGQLANLEQEKENLSNDNSYLSGEIRSKESEKQSKQSELSAVNRSVNSLRTQVNNLEAEVKRIRTLDGGFFKWVGDDLVRRADRISKYRSALNNLANARKSLIANENKAATLTEEIGALTDYISGLKSEQSSNNSRLSQLSSEISNKQLQINNTSNEIGNLKSKVENINQDILEKVQLFAQQVADLKIEFNDIDFSLADQELLGDKLLSLGLLITEQDVNFFEDIIEPAVTDFKDEINGGDTLIGSLNPTVNNLRNLVNNTNLDDQLAQAFVDSFEQLLKNQKSEVNEWLNKDYPDLVNGFKQDYKDALEAVEEIEFGHRLRALIQKGNLEEVIETVLDRINITELTNLITGEGDGNTGNNQDSLANALELKQAIHREVLDDIEKQKTILVEVDQANQYIDGNLTQLDQVAQKLFQAFEFKLPKVLGNYLQSQGDLDLNIDIEDVVSRRLDAINKSVTSVTDSIALFKDKISNQQSLNEKVESISQELEFYEQDFAFTDLESRLEEDRLSVDNLSQGTSKLTDLIQELIDSGNLDSATIQQLTTAKQNVEQLTGLSDSLTNFDSQISNIDQQLINLTKTEVDLLDVAIQYNARSKEEATLEQRLERLNRKDKENTPEAETLEDEREDLINGTVQTRNLENRYFLSPEAGTWAEIQDFAESVGGNLVTINGLAEQKFLKRVFARNLDGTPIDNAKFWIGYNDLEKEGKWRWIDGQVDNFENWGDSTNNNNRNFVFMNRDGVWKTANQKTKLRGIIELDFNSITIERLRLEDQRGDVKQEIATFLNESSDYQTLQTALETVDNALNQIRDNAGISEFTLVDLITDIRTNYAESQQSYEELDSEIKWRKASADAHRKTAEFYESAADDYLKKHTALKKKLAKFGIEVTDDGTFTETRKSYHLGIFGKSEIDVQITHVNAYWMYYENFKEQAKQAREQADALLGRIIDNENPNNNKDSMGDLEIQKNLTYDNLQGWQKANEEATQLEGYIEQLQDVIDRIKIADQQTAEYQQAVTEFEALLPNLEAQLSTAQQQAIDAYNKVKSQWESFKNESENLQQVYDEVIPLKATYRGQNLAILDQIEESRQWVTLKNQSLGILLESVAAVESQISDFLAINSATSNLNMLAVLEETLAYLGHNKALLNHRLEALEEHTQALDAQENFLLQELELIDAYFDNGGVEYSLLKQQLDQAQSNLRELQNLAENALDSSTVLTDSLNQFSAYLNNLNDESLKAVQESNNTLKDLIANLNNRTDYFKQATASLNKINEFEPQIIELLEKMKEAGETRAEKLLETALNRGLAASAWIFYNDFSDLLTDTGNFFTGGIATEGDRKLANYFLKELRQYRVVKKEAEAQADFAKTTLKQAEAQKTLLENKIATNQSEYDDLLAQIDDLEKAGAAQRQTLYELQARINTLKTLQGPTNTIIDNLEAVQTLNQGLAELEVKYANSFAEELSASIQQQIGLDALAKNYERQQLLTTIEVYEKQDAYSTLQESLIEIGRDFGLEIDPIVENTDHTAAIAELQDQLNNLETLPVFPDELQDLFAEATDAISSALKGEEAGQIEEQLTSFTQKLTEQNDAYDAELKQLKEEFNSDQKILETAETNLKAAVEEVFTAIETRNGFIENKSILTDELLGVFEQVRLAQDANSISKGIAQDARFMLESILEQRQIEREARQKTLLDFITESVGTIIAIAGTVITAGSSAGLLVVRDLRSNRLPTKIGKSIFYPDDANRTN